MIYFYIFVLVFLVSGFFMARKDSREGIIPDKWTNIGIYVGFISQFILLGFFSFQFYLYFTILILFYIIFMCLQYAMHYSGKQLGTGDVKMLLFIYAILPFHPFAFAGIFLFNILFWTIVIMFIMLSFKLAYFLYLKKLPVYKIMYGDAIDKTTLRLAPLIYLSFIISTTLLLLF
jgi:hypothetical protein